MEILFPSPTGVNHYEQYKFLLEDVKSLEDSFRPQQGLIIMNILEEEVMDAVNGDFVSVPNRG